MSSNTLEHLLIARDEIGKAIMEERENGHSPALVEAINKAITELAKAKEIQALIFQRSQPVDEIKEQAIKNCPTPEYHVTHRYCPSCPWTELHITDARVTEAGR